jgi:hypothetical protein
MSAFTACWRAIPLLEKAAVLADRSSGFIDVLAAAYARAGRRSDALRILAELKRRKQYGYVATASFVIVYLGLGENEQAFAWIEEAYKERSNMLQFAGASALQPAAWRPALCRSAPPRRSWLTQCRQTSLLTELLMIFRLEVS